MLKTTFSPRQMFTTIGVMLYAVNLIGFAPTAFGQPALEAAPTDLRVAQTLKQSSAVLSLAFSPDGKLLATSGGDSKVRLWNVKTAQLDKVLSGPSYIHAIRKVAFSTDGKTLISVSEKARLWDVATGQLQRSFSVANPNPYELKNYGPGWGMSVALSPKDDVVASTGQFLTVHSQNNSNWKQNFQQKFFYGTAVSFTPDGTTLIEAGWNGRLNLWNVADLKKGKKTPSNLSPLQGNPEALGKANSISLSGDGKLMVVAYGYEGYMINAPGKIVPNEDDGKVIVWDLTTGAVKQSWSTPKSAALSASISPDGRAVAAASGDKQIRLWNVETGELGQILPQNAKVNSVTFSPDGSTLASGDADGSIKLWDLNVTPTL